MNSKSKHPVFRVFNREVERVIKNRAYQFLLLFGPLLGIFILFSIFKQGNVKNIPIAVVDMDNSSLSIKISNMLNASQDVEVYSVTPNVLQAKKAMESGLVQGIVYIPKETERNIYKGYKAPVKLFVNGSNILLSSLVQRSTLSTIKTLSAGLEIKMLQHTAKSNEEAMAYALPVNTQKHVLFNPYTNYNYFLGALMLYTTLFLFVFLSSVYTLGNELKRGTGLTLIEAGGGSVRLSVFGKLLPYTIIYMGFAMLINLLLFGIDKMPMNGNVWLLLVGQFITIITYQLMGLIFIGVTYNLRLAMSLASAYTMMGITFSGLTFPMNGMPEIAQYFSTVFPYTWWHKLLISESLRGGSVKESLSCLCYILIFLSLSIAFLPLYKKRLSHKKYWGRV